KVLVSKVDTATALTASTTSPLLGVDTVTFTATVTAAHPDSGSPSGTVDFFDATTNTDLGSVALSNGIAVHSASFSVAGAHTITATYSGAGVFLPSSGSSALVVVRPASFSGLVFADFNNDGQVDFGESGIAGVSLSLSGTDDLGHPVSRSLTT